ncbi:hypothetical protein CI238_12348 [Colletotrichum incanum]|uniref:Uncharacterized protein n=1 Tax=Colletotrichum incanum TaxID=1573173 RepID=A0A161W703_COLIC|nr:hypothetical protein CI238_12348 [Colletotrichum incanum]OHW97864.1 hypothetical protein CSPAE12_03479 [Colletotrichum incanum]
MPYQVGRVYAMAIYTGLLETLQMLLEIFIAEEAWENGNSPIFDFLMEVPARYKVFDDYKHAVDTEPKPAFLNGDTPVKPYLDHRHVFFPPIGRMDDEEGDSESDDDEEDPRELGPRRGFEHTPFNITEDMGVNVNVSGECIARGGLFRTATIVD